MALLDKHGRPLNGATGAEKEEAPEPTPEAKVERVDVRGLPSGTLIYNLVMITNREMGAQAMLAQMEQQKVMHKQVNDHPQFAVMQDELKKLQDARFIAAQEINDRFHDSDLVRMTALGIKMWDPGELKDEPETDTH